MAKNLTKTIYERGEVCAAMVTYHKEFGGEAPKGYHWEARMAQSGVIVEPVEDCATEAKKA